jgi:hypothetical protein
VGKFEKTKTALEWLEHGRFIVEILIGLGVGSAMRAILLSLTHIPIVWITPLWLLTAALITALSVLIGNKVLPRRYLQQATVQNPTDSLIPATSTVVPGVLSPTFDAKEFFRTAYYSSVTAEVEKNIRLAAEQNDPNNREGFLVRFVGVGLVGYLHDYTWLTIFKSQLLMLLDMNGRNGWMALVDAKNYYDKASVEYPQIYSQYSFEQWIAYMKQQQLILQHPSNMLEITVRGKDFLKYLTHWGRYPDARKG